MKKIIDRSIHSAVLALVMLLTPMAVMAGHDDDNNNNNNNNKKPTVVDILSEVDGAQAVVAAVLVVDEAGVLNFSLAELLGDKNAELVVLAPSNAAFEALLGLEPGTLNGLSVMDVKDALPGLLPPGVGPSEVAAILLKHVAQPPVAKLRTASENVLLGQGSIEVADGSVFAVSVGASGVQVNYETTIIKPNIRARNGIIHFIDTVIVDELL
jgi:uncharacterized surface protein with fasciclin (FAS1) repeats